MKKDKLLVQDFANSLKDNPQAVINWAKNEIKEFENLILLVEKKTNLQSDCTDYTDYQAPNLEVRISKNITGNLHHVWNNKKFKI